MGNSKKLPRVLSLCSGYGGLEIGLERVLRDVAVLAYVEVEAVAVANLVDKMESGRMAPAPIWTDIKTFNGKIFRGSVDIITGGYPCQGFSVAGKRKGKEDPRHLWPHIKRIIKECRPEMCFFENVEGHISMGLEDVLSDMGKLGYRVEAGIFSASEVGAPHQRKRIFILGHSDESGSQGRLIEIMRKRSNEQVLGAGGSSMGHSQSNDEWRITVSTVHGEGESARGPGDDLADASRELLNGDRESGEKGRAESSNQRWPARPGEDQFEWEEPRAC